MSPHVNTCVNGQTPFLPCCIALCSTSLSLIPPGPQSTLLTLGPGSRPTPTSSLVFWFWLGSTIRMHQHMRGQEEQDVRLSIPWSPRPPRPECPLPSAVLSIQPPAGVPETSLRVTLVPCLLNPNPKNCLKPCCLPQALTNCTFVNRYLCKVS